MGKIHKIYIATRKRNKFHEKNDRAVKLKKYLEKVNNNVQIRLFKSYCQSTGAHKSIYSQFALSRHSLRKYANFGLISGVMPSSW